MAMRCLVSLTSPLISRDQVNSRGFSSLVSNSPNSISSKTLSPLATRGASRGIRLLGRPRVSIEGDLRTREVDGAEESDGPDFGVVSIHHVGLLCENLERSLAFYKDLLGLEINEARPNDKLPYRGAWLWVGSEMIHLMELPNPDPLTGRPEHGGRDRHACIAIRDVSKLKAIFDKAAEASQILFSSRISFRPSSGTGKKKFGHVDLLFRRNSLIAPYSFTMEKLLFVVRSLKERLVINWESLLLHGDEDLIEQIEERAKRGSRN